MDRPDEEQRILDTFIQRGRLVVIPAKRHKRLVVLDQIAQDFEPGTKYTETEVNAFLRCYHDDVAALRRHLVDEHFLTRESGTYWRSGGTVTV